MSFAVLQSSSGSEDSHDEGLEGTSQGNVSEHINAIDDVGGAASEEVEAVVTGTPGQPGTTDGQDSAESEHKGNSAEGSTELQFEELHVRVDSMEVKVDSLVSMISDIWSKLKPTETSNTGKPHTIGVDRKPVTGLGTASDQSTAEVGAIAPNKLNNHHSEAELAKEEGIPPAKANTNGLSQEGVDEHIAQSHQARTSLTSSHPELVISKAENETASSLASTVRSDQTVTFNPGGALTTHPNNWRDDEVIKHSNLTTINVKEMNGKASQIANEIHTQMRSILQSQDGSASCLKEHLERAFHSTLDALREGSGPKKLGLFQAMVLEVLWEKVEQKALTLSTVASIIKSEVRPLVEEFAKMFQHMSKSNRKGNVTGSQPSSWSAVTRELEGKLATLAKQKGICVEHASDVQKKEFSYPITAYVTQAIENAYLMDIETARSKSFEDVWQDALVFYIKEALEHFKQQKDKKFLDSLLAEFGIPNWAKSSLDNLKTIKIIEEGVKKFFCNHGNLDKAKEQILQYELKNTEQVLSNGKSADFIKGIKSTKDSSKKKSSPADATDKRKLRKKLVESLLNGGSSGLTRDEVVRLNVFKDLRNDYPPDEAGYGSFAKAIHESNQAGTLLALADKVKKSRNKFNARNVDSGKGICFRFKNEGYCRYGDNCRYRHELGNSTDTAYRQPPNASTGSEHNNTDLDAHRTSQHNVLAMLNSLNNSGRLNDFLQVFNSAYGFTEGATPGQGAQGGEQKHG